MINNTSFIEHEKIIEEKYTLAVKGLDPAWFEKDENRWYDHIISLPENLKITYLVMILDNQVFNGGFEQYFVNVFGIFAQETILALKTIGAVRKSRLLSDAYNLVNFKKLPDSDFKALLLDRNIPQLYETDELYEPLDKLDNLYYNLEEEEDIVELLGNYLFNWESR